MKPVKFECTDKEVTPWAGMTLLGQMLRSIDFQTVLNDLPAPVQGSNRGYPPGQLMLKFLVSVWCGANCFEQLEVTRSDEVIRELFGWDRMAGHRAVKRYFEKFDQATNQRVFESFYRWFFGQLQFYNYTLDFDSSVLTRYGQQEGANKGYKD